MNNKQLSEGNNRAADPVDRLLQEKKPAPSGNPIAVLALLVSLAAVVTSVWLWWQVQQAAPGEDSQQSSIASLQAGQQSMADSVAALRAEIESLELPVGADQFARQGAQLGALEQRVADLQDQSLEDQASIGAAQGNMRSLEQRLSATESGLLSVAASNQNSSVELDIAEIDYLLRVASERLQLFADIEAADLALQAADLQTAALNDPMYLSVRQRIAEARQALALVPEIDRIELSARLSGMQSRIGDLPFKGESAPAVEEELPEDAGWWASFKHTLASLVTVRRRVPEEQAMLSLEDKDYLRQGLWLQLESARLALMRGDAATYVGSLDRVGTTVEQFFQVGEASVRELLLATADLKGADIAPAMPDISAPWTQLRQIRDSRRLLQQAAPIENGDNGE